MNKPSTNGDRSQWTLADLLARSGVRPVGQVPIPDATITSLSDDSRRVRPGACFVAVRGSVDGHAYVAEAIQAGAAAVVVDRPVPVEGHTAIIPVADSRMALARMASAYYGLSDPVSGSMQLVGITGTNGKTTTSWMLRSILRQAGYPTALLGTIEYDLVVECVSAALTTPGSLELCRRLAVAREAGATHAVLEVSSHALDQRRCDGMRFAAGVFTNLSGDHLDYHGDAEHYAAAKRHLFDLLDAEGVGVINWDDETGRSIGKALESRLVSYGMDADGVDVSAEIRSMDGSGTRFVLRGRSFQRTVQLPLVGAYNVSNALAAGAVAEAIGIGPGSIQTGLEAIDRVPGRLERVEPPGWPFSVVVDFAHTDAALANVLKTLRPLTQGRLICVFGCGGDRDRSKRPRMTATVTQYADVGYLTSDNPRTEDPQRIINDALKGHTRSMPCRLHVEVDRRSAIAAAIDNARPGDAVLIAGKGHETYQRIGTETLPFDDVAVARDCLAPARILEFVP